MDVIDTWTGRHACALQSALRMTNEQFADRLGVAVRTVAAWHQDLEIVPRADMQQILDVAYERASQAVQKRFALLNRATAPTRGAQALLVAITVVVRGDDVLLVCRRGDDSLTWQFPAGIVKPGASPESVAVQETHAETGVHCAIRQHLGERLHPVTGAWCDYWLADYLAGDARNADMIENMDVAWAPRSQLTRFIPADRIYPPVRATLEAIA